MPSRRRSRNKNIGNNLAEVSRRLRTLERRPVRTKLGNRIVKTSSLAPNSVTPDEVNFGTAVITTDPVPYIENPKDGLFVVNSDTGSTSVYSEEDDSFYLLADTTAQADAAQAAQDAADAAAAATAASLSANGKNAVFRGPASAYAPASAPTATKVGDIWFDSSAIPGDAVGSRPKRWTGTSWEPFGLSYAAITSIDADTITTGTLVGRTVKTSSSGNRVEMSNQDELLFWGVGGNSLVGKIGPEVFSNTGLILTGGDAVGSSAVISMTGSGYAGDAAVRLEVPSGSQILVTDTQVAYQGAGGIIIYAGGATSESSLDIQNGQGGMQYIDWSSPSAYGTSIYSYGGSMIINGEDYLTLGAGTGVSIFGELILGPDTYQQGTGAPTGTPASGTGTIRFRYT